MNTELWFRKTEGKTQVIEGFVDSDFAGSMDSRKSLTGFVFTMYGTTVCCKSTLQSVVALSTCEAEFIALTEAIKERRWLLGLVDEMGIKQRCITVHCDNRGAIYLTKHQVFNERSSTLM